MEHNTLSYMEIGEQLAKRREELGVTITEVSTALRIRDTYLRAIESGNVDQIPVGIYRDGYIKSYAQFLNLNLDLDKAKTGMTPEQLEIATRNIRVELSSPSKLTLWGSVCIVILINILLYYIK